MISNGLEEFKVEYVETGGMILRNLYLFEQRLA